MELAIEPERLLPFVSVSSGGFIHPRVFGLATLGSSSCCTNFRCDVTCRGRNGNGRWRSLLLCKLGFVSRILTMIHLASSGAAPFGRSSDFLLALEPFEPSGLALVIESVADVSRLLLREAFFFAELTKERCLSDMVYESYRGLARQQSLGAAGRPSRPGSCTSGDPRDTSRRGC